MLGESSDVSRQEEVDEASESAVEAEGSPADGGELQAQFEGVGGHQRHDGDENGLFEAQHGVTEDVQHRDGRRKAEQRRQPYVAH
jgi:hypothetical protein